MSASTPIGLRLSARRFEPTAPALSRQLQAQQRERPLLKQLGSTLLARIQDELLRAESRRPKGADERRRSLSVLTSALSGACRNANSASWRVYKEACGFPGSEQGQHRQEDGPEWDEGRGGGPRPTDVQCLLYCHGGHEGAVWDRQEGGEGDPERETYPARVA